MDFLHSVGVDFIVHLQTKHNSYEDWISLASAVADLHTLFFILFPIWFHLRRDTAVKLIWVTAIGDWINMVLKWVLFGERPYWWVHESQFYAAGSAPSLQQSPISCETGPGSPSGHAMASVEVWSVMVSALLAIATEKRCPSLLYRFLQIGLWILVVLIEVWVCTSRVYIATHFPHQVIAGVIIGLMVVAVVSKMKWIYRASMKTYFFVVVFMTFSGFGFYNLLIVLGVDLMWTMEKAQKWCVRADWVHLDSNPLASLVRNMGSMFGLGLGLHSALYTEKKNTSTSFKMGCVIVSLVLLQLLDGWTFSSQNHLLFYCLSFVKHAIALLISTTLVPWAISRIFKGKRDKKKL
ncbi:hypothetical protein LDENG_00117670 [Lucifuga dentata]|nr:hypothetical protein LDENG_00117670 [Lucifuga dentata]